MAMAECTCSAKPGQEHKKFCQLRSLQSDGGFHASTVGMESAPVAQVGPQYVSARDPRGEPAPNGSLVQPHAAAVADVVPTWRLGMQPGEQHYTVVLQMTVSGYGKPEGVEKLRQYVQGRLRPMLGLTEGEEFVSIISVGTRDR